MKRAYLLLLGILSLMIFSCSEDDAVTPEAPKEPSANENTFLSIDEATVVAKQFIEAQELLGPETKAADAGLEMVYTDLQDGVETKSGDNKPAYYIFNIGETGYVIVSASKATLPVLGYSTDSKFNVSSIPTNMAGILLDFKNEINSAREKGLELNASILEARNEFLDGTMVKTKARSYAVSPILGAIKWNQSPYYNALCPTGTPVGCVATAASQIMRHWRYPASSTGYHSYDAGSHGTLSFDYNYTLNWDAMPKGTLRGPNREVAKFCYGVAVALDMNFSPRGSGSYQFNVPGVLQTYYRYPSTVTNIYRRSYTDTNWAKIIRRELDAGRPVQYAGHGNGGGHSFVCDGYRSNGYFHFNWGWGGMSDGYFLLNALNPGNLGDGGGTGGFNAGQQAVINFQPAGNPDPDPDPDPNPSTYCDSKASNSTYTYIKGVEIGDMTNYTTGSSAGYVDYTYKKAYVQAGTKVHCKLVPGFYSRAYEMYWSGWIDLNNDGQFNDDSERFAHVSDSSEIAGTFTLPSSLAAGSYRVRIAVKYGAYATACETFNHGEVEDYTIVIR